MQTVDSCFMLPVLQHKAGNVRDFWDDVSEQYGSDTDGHFKLLGIEKALVFLQTIPGKGDFMVMYLRSRDNLDKTLKGLFSSDLKCSKYLAGQFKDFTGVDMSRSENLLKPQLLMSWMDNREYLEERNMLKMPWCFAMPIKPGKTDSALKFFNETMKPLMGDMEKLFRDHDIVSRLAFLQRTQQGDFIVNYMLASNALDELVMSLTTCSHELCSIIRKNCMDFTGLDFSDQKNLPNVNLLFKWDSMLGFQTAEQTIAYTE